MTEATETAVAEIVERLRQPIRCLSRTATEGSKEVEDFYALGDVILANEGDVHLANWTRDRAATALEQEHAARVKAEGERDEFIALKDDAVDFGNEVDALADTEIAELRTRLAAAERDNAQLREALHLLSNEVQVILNDLGPGGYLLPSGAGKTNALASTNREARALLQGEPS